MTQNPLTPAQKNEITILMAAIEAEYRTVGHEAYDASIITMETAEDISAVEIADDDELFLQHGITITGGHERSAWTLFVADATEEDRCDEFPVYFGETEGPAVNSYQEMLWEWSSAIEGVIRERDRFRDAFAESIREAGSDS